MTFKCSDCLKFIINQFINVLFHSCCLKTSEKVFQTTTNNVKTIYFSTPCNTWNHLITTSLLIYMTNETGSCQAPHTHAHTHTSTRALTRPRTWAYLTYILEIIHVHALISASAVLSDKSVFRPELLGARSWSRNASPVFHPGASKGAEAQKCKNAHSPDVSETNDWRFARKADRSRIALTPYRRRMQVGGAKKKKNSPGKSGKGAMKTFASHTWPVASNDRRWRHIKSLYCRAVNCPFHKKEFGLQQFSPSLRIIGEAPPPPLLYVLQTRASHNVLTFSYWIIRCEFLWRQITNVSFLKTKKKTHNS